MKRKIELDIKCPGCDKMNRVYHAKGLCKACYIKEYRKEKRQNKVTHRVAVDV